MGCAAITRLNCRKSNGPQEQSLPDRDFIIYPPISAAQMSSIEQTSKYQLININQSTQTDGLQYNPIRLRITIMRPLCCNMWIIYGETIKVQQQVSEHLREMYQSSLQLTADIIWSNEFAQSQLYPLQINEFLFMKYCKKDPIPSFINFTKTRVNDTYCKQFIQDPINTIQICLIGESNKDQYQTGRFTYTRVFDVTRIQNFDSIIAEKLTYLFGPSDHLPTKQPQEQL